MTASALAAVIAAAWPMGPAAQAQSVVSVPPGSDLRITVYQTGPALFMERRRVTVAAGLNELQFTDLPVGVADLPVDLRVLSGPALRWLDQRYVSTPEGRAPALSALVGQTVAVVRRGADGKEAERLVGTLLAVNAAGGVGALQVGDQVVLDPAGEVQVTREQLPQLTRPPMLVCRAESAAAGEVDLLLSYLIDKAAWEAQHCLVLAEDGATMSLTSWANLHLPSAVWRVAAGVRLTPGDPASPSRPQAYEVDRAVGFGNSGDVRLVLAEAAKVPVASLLLLDAGSLGALAQGKPLAAPVARVERFANDAASGLGAPLPPGRAVVYQRAGAAGARLVSQAALPPAAAGATVDVVLGAAVGLSGTSRQVSWRQLSPEDVERKCEVVLANSTGAAQTVTCGVTMAGQWKIADASQPYVTRPGDRVEFAVPCPADRKAVTLSYTVRIHVTPEPGQTKTDETVAPPTPGGKDHEEAARG